MPPYETQSPDTSPEIEAFLFDAWRRMSSAERLRRIGDLGKLVEAVAGADIRRRYPQATEREVRLRLAARQYDRDLMIQAFGWDPEVEGY